MTDINTYTTAPELTAAGASWRRSSYSDGAGQNCVEVADLCRTPYRGVAVRDSKNPDGPALLVSPASFGALLDLVRSGACDFGIVD